MKRRLIITALTLIVVLPIVYGVGVVGAGGPDKNSNFLTGDQIAGLIHKAIKQLDDALTGRVDALDSEVGELRGQVGTMREELETQQRNIIDLNQRVTTLEDALQLLKPAPTSWWPGDENAQDIQGSNDGILKSGVSFAQGKLAQGFLFDGGDDHVEIPFAQTLTTADASVEAWVKPLSAVSDPINQEVIFAQSNGALQMVVRQGTTGLIVGWFFKGTEAGLSHCSAMQRYQSAASAT